MADIDINRKIMFVAGSNYGKTFAVHNLLKELAKKYQIYFYDTNSEINKFLDIPNLIFFPNPNLPGQMMLKRTDLNTLNRFLIKVRKQINKPSVIFIDDLEQFFFESKHRLAGELKNLYSAGRHQEIIMIVCAKQLSFIPALIMSQTNLLYIGRFDIKDITSYEKARKLTHYDLQQLKINENKFIELDSYNNTEKIVRF